MREVEAKIVGRDQAAILGDMRAEMPAQRRVQQMRRAMVGADAVAALGIDFLMDALANRQLARDDLRAQDVELAKLLRRILNFANESLERGQFPGVADLAAALAVEWCLIEQELDRLAHFGVLHALTVLDDR